MNKNRILAGGLSLLLAVAWTPSLAAAQSATPASDARPDAQKAAFLTMPEADRKATQEALGWLGLYNGAVDGTFGKRTRDSILAYQQRANAAGDGIVSPAQLEALKAATQRARAGADFALVDDTISGVRIGAPLKLLPKLKPSSADTTLQSGDGALSLSLAERTPPGNAADDAGLAALYGQLTAETGRRKITYKALKAGEFFVVAGEDRGAKFYTRFARAPADWPQGPALRGFTFAYPSERASDLDTIALAVANSFEPFANTPASHGAAAARAKPARSALDVVRVAAGAPAPAGLPVTGLSSGSRPAPTPLAPSPTPSAPAVRAELFATALYVAPGQALTAAPVGQCAELSVDRKPAKLLRADPASGLALLGGEFAPAATAPMLASGASDLVVLSLALGAGGKSTLEASPGVVAPLADGSRAVVAALTQSAGGAPAFDRSGALAGIVASIATPPRRIGAVTLVEPHKLIGAEAVAAFLALGAPAPAAGQGALGAGEIALRVRGALAQVVCKP